MNDLPKLLASLMLAAGQAVYSFQTTTAASAQVPSQADVTSSYTIKLTTALPTGLVFDTPRPDFDREVLAPLRQAQAAQAARAAAQAKAVAAAAARARVTTRPVSYNLPPGSHTDWMAAAGISPSDYGYINYIFQHESSWNPWECNPTGHYCGLGQTNPAKLAAVCPNWQTDPVCQIRFFNGYALGSYGSWARAYAHKVSLGWW